MHSETFLTYGMTIVHLGVSLSFFLSSFFLVLAASILSGYPLFLKTFFTCFLSFSSSCSVLHMLSALEYSVFTTAILCEIGW